MDIAPSALQGRTSKLLIGSESDARKHFLPRVQKELEQAFLDGLLDKGYRPVLLKDRLSNNERFQLHALDWKTSKDVKILNSFASRLCSKHQLSSVIYAHYKVRLLDAAATDDFGEGVLHWFAADGEPLNYTVFTVSRGPPPTDGFLAAIVEYRPNLASFDLIQAATDGQTEKVKALIARGADRNADDKYGVEFGDTALFAAVLNGHSETAKVLLEWGSNISEQEDIAGLNCIIAAAWKGHTETLRVLLDFLTDVNDAWEDTNGRTPLMWAASEGHSETVSTLLDADADVDVTDHNRKTALMFGASRGHIGTVNVLLGAGGDVNSKDGAGWTPLIIAADAGHFNVVETLLNAGADVNARAEDGWAALIDSERWLALIRAADIAHISISEALGRASRRGDPWAVQAVKGLGFPYTLPRNKKGGTALTVAEREGHTKIVELLKKAEARE